MNFIVRPQSICGACVQFNRSHQDIVVPLFDAMGMILGLRSGFVVCYCDRIHTKEFSRRQRKRSYAIWLKRDNSVAHTRLLRTCLRHRTGDTSPLSKKLACPGRLLSKRLCMHRRSFLREQCMHRCILSPFSETLHTKAVEAGPSKDFFDP